VLGLLLLLYDDLLGHLLGEEDAPPVGGVDQTDVIPGRIAPVLLGVGLRLALLVLAGLGLLDLGPDGGGKVVAGLVVMPDGKKVGIDWEECRQMLVSETW